MKSTIAPTFACSAVSSKNETLVAAHTHTQPQRYSIACTIHILPVYKILYFPYIYIILYKDITLAGWVSPAQKKGTRLWMS